MVKAIKIWGTMLIVAAMSVAPLGHLENSRYGQDIPPHIVSSISYSEILPVFAPEDISNGMYMPCDGMILFDMYMERHREVISDTEYIYDERFAGVWFDSTGGLNIAVTQESNKPRKRSQHVNYQVNRFSYNFLNTAQEFIVSLMSNYSIMSSAVKPQYNNLHVTLQHEKYIQYIAKHLSVLTPHINELIYFKICGITAETISRPIHGGDGINRPGIGTGTLSAKAVDASGRWGIITNEHVAPLGARLYHDRSGNRLIGTTANALHGGRLDAAFIPFANQDDWQFTSSAAHDNTVHDRTHLLERSRIVVGLDVVKFGRSSGRTTGRITSINYGFTGSSGARFTNYLLHTAYATFGDSGSPLMTVMPNGRHYLLGFISHSRFVNGGNVAMAMNVHNVKADLGVTIMTANTYAPVRSVQQLNSLRHSMHGNFRLASNIPLSGNWTPIHMFLGTFDGSGFEISGLNIGIATGTANHYYGFIGILGGTVRNLNIRGNITGARQHASRFRDVNVGMVAGVSPGDIINVTVHGSINVDRIHARIGGISGDNSGGVIHNSRNNASIRSSGNIGGITADNTGTITQSFNNASIIFDPTSVARNVGGIAGFNWNSMRNNGNYGGIEISSPMPSPSRLGMVIGYNRTTPFDTTNYNRGTAFHRGGISFGNDQFTFRQFAGRVGFQQGIAAPAPTPVPPPPTPPSNCVADGTLITLANGSQVRVEDLTGDEMLLVWDFRTGTFTSAPIMFIDNDAREYKEVAKLSFANGNYVKIIDAHGFFSTTLNKYVRITTYNAYQFVGQYFLKHSSGENMAMERVRLVDTDVFMHYTASWNPIAPNHFAFFANGMLSAPGLFVRMGFLNVFTVDAETLAFCVESYLADIEMFGLLSFEQFNQIMPGLPEVFFYAFNGQYLQIKMGRGLITWDDLNELVERYGALLAA